MATSTAQGVPIPSSAERPGSSRWHSLDVLKGLALWGLIAHHFQKWAGGQVDERFIGFDHFVVTDLAAPLFGTALGAAAMAVGARTRSWSDLPAPMLRWAQILGVGVGIDLATHGGAVRGTGVLPTLALLGMAVTVATTAGVRRPLTWWAITAACVVLAVPASEVSGDGVLELLLNGPFSLPTYGVFAAAGAAVAAAGLGQPESRLPLVRAATGVLVVGAAAAELAGGVVAPEGIWPPARYPGHLGFTLWGLGASFVLWALARALLPRHRAVGAAVGRAGQRTLFVFTAHFGVKIVLRHLGVLGDLDTRWWGWATWGAVALLCAASTIPRRSRRGPTIVT